MGVGVKYAASLRDPKNFCATYRNLTVPNIDFLVKTATLLQGDWQSIGIETKYRDRYAEYYCCKHDR